MEPASIPRVDSVALIFMYPLPGISGHLTALCIAILGNGIVSLIALT